MIKISELIEVDKLEPKDLFLADKDGISEYSGLASELQVPLPPTLKKKTLFINNAPPDPNFSPHAAYPRVDNDPPQQRNVVFFFGFPEDMTNLISVDVLFVPSLGLSGGVPGFGGSNFRIRIRYSDEGQPRNQYTTSVNSLSQFWNNPFVVHPVPMISYFPNAAAGQRCRILTRSNQSPITSSDTSHYLGVKIVYE